MSRESDNPTADAVNEAVRRAESLRRESDWGLARHQRFRGLYGCVMDEVRSSAQDRGVSMSEVGRAYEALVRGNPHLTSHVDLMERTGMDYHDARQAAAVLSDTGDFHECYDDDWNLYWVRCDEFIREKCEERRISLCRYYMMHETLVEFQDKVTGWYVRRNRRQQQPFNLRDLKAEYVERLQEEYFPDKPVGDEWSRHIAARYLRTAQDSIVRSLDLTY